MVLEAQTVMLDESEGDRERWGDNVGLWLDNTVAEAAKLGLCVELPVTVAVEQGLTLSVFVPEDTTEVLGEKEENGEGQGETVEV